MSFLLVSGKGLLVGGRMLRVGLAADTTTPPPDEGPPVGDGSVVLTLNDIDKDRRLFQHVGGKYDVLVSGTTTGTATVQARAIDAVTGAAVTAWVNMPTSGGSFSGALETPARVQLMKLEVRDSVNTASTKMSAKRFKVGGYWYWSGQSNAYNAARTPYRYPISSVGADEYIGGVYKRIGTYSTTEAFPPNTLSTTYGSNATIKAEDGERRGDAYVYLANILCERLGYAICLVQNSAIGQPISSWDNGADLWTDFENSLAAIGGDAEGMIFYQGEQNSVENTPYGVYLGGLGSFHNRVLAKVGRTVDDFAMGIVSLGAVAGNSNYANNIDDIRAAQVYFANHTPGVFLAASNHDCRTGSTDPVHVNNTSYAHLGPAMALSAAFAKLGTGVSGAGPRTVSGVRSGAQLDFTVQHAGGTLLKDGAGGTGTALTGFSVYLASDTQKAAPLAIASTLITGAGSYRLTLAANPGAPVVVDYAMGPAPHAPDLSNSRVDPAYASAIYDNVALVNNTRGCVMQPFANLAVAEG